MVEGLERAAVLMISRYGLLLRLECRLFALIQHLEKLWSGAEVAIWLGWVNMQLRLLSDFVPCLKAEFVASEAARL